MEEVIGSYCMTPVYFLLKKWLALMKSSPDRETAEIMALAENVSPLLLSYLEMNQFFGTWQSIRKNTKQYEGLRRQFHFWFDGFKTMKLIRFLTDRGFPKIDMFEALAGLLHMQQSEGSLNSKESDSYPFVS